MPPLEKKQWNSNPVLSSRSASTKVGLEGVQDYFFHNFQRVNAYLAKAAEAPLLLSVAEQRDECVRVDDSTPGSQIPSRAVEQRRSG